MSSLNESTEYTSQNDSIPIDAAPSFTGTSEDRTSVDPYDDEESPYDDEDDFSDYGDEASGSHTLDASNSYVTGRSGATPTQTTRSRKSGQTGTLLGASASGDGGTGISEEYGQTGYGSRSEATSASFYGDYSSGYDMGGSTSYGYDDTTIRSPRSGSEMSSTFTSFYYDNEHMLRIRRTLSFFRRPIYFFLFSAVGSGVVGGVCQAVRLLTKSVEVPAAFAGVIPSPRAVVEGLPQATGAVPSGYPNVPEWLREVRLSLPAMIEKPVSWTLERHGIPVLTEARKASATAVKSVTEAVQEVVETWRVSSPMIPAGLFLPLFTFGALHVASKVMAKRNHTDTGDYDFLGSVSNYNADTHNHSVITPNTRAKLSGVGSSFSLKSPGQNSEPHSEPVPDRNAHNRKGRGRTNYTSGSSGGSNTLGSTIPAAVQGADSLSPSMDATDLAAAMTADPAAPVQNTESPASLQRRFTSAVTGEGGDGAPRDLGVDLALERARSRSRTQAPQTARHTAPNVSPNPRAIIAPGDETPDRAAGAGGDAVGELVADSPGELGLSPVMASDASGGVSPAPAVPEVASDRAFPPGLTPLQGDVIVAVLGGPSTAEANAVLMAAAKYGCSAVILPNTLSPSEMAPTPPSINVEYVRNVIERATAFAQRRALAVTTVFRTNRSPAATAANAVALPSYHHRQNALYVFMPAAVEASSEASEAAAIATDSVYVNGGHIRSGDNIPVNECFYDRLAKERHQ